MKLFSQLCTLLCIIGTISSKGPKKRALLAVASSCNQPLHVSSSLMSTLVHLKDHGDSDTFSVLIMCYDVIHSKFSHVASSVGPLSLATLCLKHNVSLWLSEHPCVLHDLVPSLDISVVSTAASTTKIFKPDPRGLATIVASKVHLWKHHLEPSKVAHFDYLFAWY